MTDEHEIRYKKNKIITNNIFDTQGSMLYEIKPWTLLSLMTIRNFVLNEVLKRILNYNDE